MNDKKFTAKAMCLFTHNGKLLLYENNTRDGIRFYRPPGGHIEHGEFAEQAVVREVMEEIEAEITNVKLWRILENIFAFEGKLRHEYVFCFTAGFKDPKWYNEKKIFATEDNREQILCWYSRQDIENHKMFVVPKGILDVLE